MANDQFPPEIVEILSKEFLMDPGKMQMHLDAYLGLKGHCPDAPDVDAIVPADIYAVLTINNYDAENKETWAEFVARKTKINISRAEAHDPFLANWNSKNETKQNPWVGDTGELAAEYQEAVNRALRHAAPISTGEDPMEAVGTPPISEDGILKDIVASLSVVSPIVAEGMGESTDDNMVEFRWSRALVMLAGLGFDSLRFFAKKMSRTESEWDYWATCTDHELRTDVLKAREVSGYPMALLRADYVALQRICADGTLSPRWIKASLAVHIFKYVRLIENYKDGKPALWMAHKGSFAHVLFDNEAMTQTLADPINRNLRQSICMHLGIRQERGRNRQDIDEKIDQVLARLHPCDFARVRDLKTSPYLIVPPAVKICAAHERKVEYKWIDTGIEVTGVAAIDLETGKVEETVIDGPATISLNWPRGYMTEADNKTWWANLPRVVTPLLPSQFIKLIVRNICTLGHPNGYYPLLDAAILIDLIREELAGTTVGNSLVTEYPLMMIYPMGHTKETTTNQGKTNLARIIGNIFANGLPVTPCSKSPSAPAQRVMSSGMERYGTAIIDEFQLPESHDHFLAQAGLQSFATGSKGGPGRVGENSEGFKLQHPLLFTCKIAAFPPDVRNRTIPTFMDIVTDESRCSPEDLSLMTSGKLSYAIRLAALMWIHKTEFIQKVSALRLAQGKLRYDGHMTVATHLAGGDATAINAYLIDAEAQCEHQMLLADASGLADNIGVAGKFDPYYFFCECSDLTLKIVCDMTNSDQVTCLPSMKAIIEDNGSRKFADIVRANGGKERSLLLQWSDAIKNGIMERPDGWKLSWVRKGGEKAIGAKGEHKVERQRDCVVLTQLKSQEKSGTPKTKPIDAK